MGLVNGTVVLKNPRLPEVDPVEVEALADSGALHLCIPEHVKIQLRLEAIDCKEVTLADGSRKVVEYVGPIELHFKNRRVCWGLRSLVTRSCSARYLWKTWTSSSFPRLVRSPLTPRALTWHRLSRNEDGENRDVLVGVDWDERSES
jgi:hypothetical protein